MKDFISKHPIVTMLMFGDLCVLINNVVRYVTNTDAKGNRFLKDRVGTVLNDGIENIKEQLNKSNKVEIGFHK